MFAPFRVRILDLSVIILMVAAIACCANGTSCNNDQDSTPTVTTAPTETPVPAGPSSAISVDAKVDVRFNLVEMQPPAGAYAQITGSDIATEPTAKVKTDTSGNADIVITVSPSGEVPICNQYASGRSVVMPNGAGDPVLIELEVGTLVCRNDVDKLNELQFSSGDKVIFGSTIKVTFIPDEKAIIAVAEGSALYLPVREIVEDREPMREFRVTSGEDLYVDLNRLVADRRPTNFDEFDLQNFERFNVPVPEPSTELLPKSEFGVLHLIPGTNLVSVPRPLRSPDINDLFADSPVDSVITFDSDAVGGWLVAIKDESGVFVGNQSVFDIEPGRGYYVNSNNFFDLELEFGDDVFPEIEIELDIGWNLVGYVSAGEPFMTVDEYFADLQGSIQEAHGFNEVRNQWHSTPINQEEPPPIPSQEFPGPLERGVNLEFVEAGQAYWIYMIDNAFFVP